MEKTDFYRIPARMIGEVDGMEVMVPTKKAWDDYRSALHCFFNIGDTIMLLDKSKYTEEQLYKMTGAMQLEWMFKDKNYILAKVIKRAKYYIICDSSTPIHRINSKQHYAECITYETEDGDRHTVYCQYYLIGGLVNEGQYSLKSNGERRN